MLLAVRLRCSTVADQPASSITGSLVTAGPASHSPPEAAGQSVPRGERDVFTPLELTAPLRGRYAPKVVGKSGELVALSEPGQIARPMIDIVRDGETVYREFDKVMDEAEAVKYAKENGIKDVDLT